ncbi:GLY-15 protein [Aphelenchoides avenae]|nr:GLY-15 protein [Aphelenchus avenae]
MSLFVLIVSAISVSSAFAETAEGLDKVKATLDRLPGFSESVDCDAVFDGDEEASSRAGNWAFDAEMFWNETVSTNLSEACASIRDVFGFFDHPLSDEEREFPLAYGMLVYQNAPQVYFMLSELYQPQNAFCIAVDAKATPEFKERMALLSECFPNIIVLGVGDVQWGSYEIVRGVYRCFQHLAESQHRWEYYQYLSGVEAPLKTNLEMVRIFKQFGGAAVANVVEQKLWPNVTAVMQPPVTIWKSSQSTVISRRTANDIVRSEKVAQLVQFLKLIYIPDERLWMSAAGNPSELSIYGGSDARALIMRLQEGDGGKKWTDPPVSPQEPFRICSYWIGRYQIWNDGPEASMCNGIYTHDSCVFGVRDLPVLVKRAELVAHKVYFDVQPATFFCLYKRVRERSFDWTQKLFKGEVYGQLPQVQLFKGAKLEDIRTRFSCPQ